MFTYEINIVCRSFVVLTWNMKKTMNVNTYDHTLNIQASIYNYK